MVSEPEGSSRDLFCAICERMCEPVELQTCASCYRKFCTYCAYRIGGRDYCGRSCGQTFFFGGDFGGEDEPEEEP